MLKKIDKEINEFTASIKSIEGHDELLDYMNGNISSAVKLLMFASKTFSSYIKVILFFLISSTALSIFSSIAASGNNASILFIVTLFLYVFVIIFIMKIKKDLILNIKNSKNMMDKEL